MAHVSSSQQTLADVGEEGVLAAIFPVLQAHPVGLRAEGPAGLPGPSDSDDLRAEGPAGLPGPSKPDPDLILLGPGDDCAVLAAPDGRVVITTDVIVEGHDFLLSTSSGWDVGAKAAAQNLADIASMGAVPTALVVGLVAPGSTPLAWVVDFSRGLADTAGPAGARVVGGDLSGGPALMVSVTVLGDLQGRRAVTRAAARPGDVLAMAGSAGRAAAGLAALQAGRADDLRLAGVVAVQRTARPPLTGGPAAADAGATAMIDLSDGLLRDAGRVARASRVRLVLDADSDRLAALHEELTAVAVLLGEEDPGHRAWEWLMGGGEDHGLLAAFPTSAQVPELFEVIGRVESGSGVEVSGLSTSTMSIGWDHYSG